mgnify:CR=1 FL=1
MCSHHWARAGGLARSWQQVIERVPSTDIDRAVTTATRAERACPCFWSAAAFRTHARRHGGKNSPFPDTDVALFSQAKTHRKDFNSLFSIRIQEKDFNSHAVRMADAVSLALTSRQSRLNGVVWSSLLLSIMALSARQNCRPRSARQASRPQPPDHWPPSQSTPRRRRRVALAQAR